MSRTKLTMAVLTLGSSSVPAMATSTKSYCTLAWLDDSMPLMEGACVQSVRGERLRGRFQLLQVRLSICRAGQDLQACQQVSAYLLQSLRAVLLVSVLGNPTLEPYRFRLFTGYF